MNLNIGGSKAKMLEGELYAIETFGSIRGKGINYNIIIELL